MLKFYIINFIVSYISINCAQLVTRDNWNKLPSKNNGFIKRNTFKIAMCLIPLFRWFMVAFVLIVGIALGNKEFADEINERLKEDNE